MEEQIKAILNDDGKLTQIAREAFNETDTDKSGQIDAAELEAAMGKISKEVGINAPTKQEVDEVLKALDTDKSGKVSFDEFKVFIRKVLEALSGSA